LRLFKRTEQRRPWQTKEKTGRSPNRRAIKTALDDFANDEERRAAFLRLLACVRTLTARISVSGKTT